MNVLTSRIQLVETDHPVLFNLEMTKLLSDADPDFPFATALALKNNGYDANGIMGDWRHLLHGHHYRFQHMKTG
jgi:hypothetical protein